MFIALALSGVDHVCVCCRVISRAPGLKLVVETLITSLRPIGNIVLICCAFFIVFGILGVQVRIYIDSRKKKTFKLTVFSCCFMFPNIKSLLCFLL